MFAFLEIKYVLYSYIILVVCVLYFTSGNIAPRHLHLQFAKLRDDVAHPYIDDRPFPRVFPFLSLRYRVLTWNRKKSPTRSTAETETVTDGARR